MLIISLSSGLGNQLFMYAFYLYLKQTLEENVTFETSSFTQDFSGRSLELSILLPEMEVTDFYWSYKGNRPFIAKIFKKIRRFLPLVKIVDDSKIYIPAGKKNRKMLFVGYWQSEYYVRSVKNFSKYFMPKEEIPKQLVLYKSKILVSSVCVSLHIRRGDYFTDKFANRYSVCTKKYYQSAIDYIVNSSGSADFFIFSDDMDWVKSNIDFPEGLNVCYVENFQINNFWYIYLMSLCHHNIISNSTFSWWGAYLNKNTEKIVIAPSRWTLDSDQTLVLDSWIKLSC